MHASCCRTTLSCRCVSEALWTPQSLAALHQILLFRLWLLFCLWLLLWLWLLLCLWLLFLLWLLFCLWQDVIAVTAMLGMNP